MAANSLGLNQTLLNIPFAFSQLYFLQIIT